MKTATSSIDLDSTGVPLDLDIVDKNTEKINLKSVLPKKSTPKLNIVDPSKTNVDLNNPIISRLDKELGQTINGTVRDQFDKYMLIKKNEIKTELIDDIYGGRKQIEHIEEVFNENKELFKRREGLDKIQKKFPDIKDLNDNKVDEILSIDEIRQKIKNNEPITRDEILKFESRFEEISKELAGKDEELEKKDIELEKKDDEIYKLKNPDEEDLKELNSKEIVGLERNNKQSNDKIPLKQPNNKQSSRKATLYELYKDGIIVDTFKSKAAIATHIGIHRSVIDNIISGRSRDYKNYKITII